MLRHGAGAAARAHHALTTLQRAASTARGHVGAISVQSAAVTTAVAAAGIGAPWSAATCAQCSARCFSTAARASPASPAAVAGLPTAAASTVAWPPHSDTIYQLSSGLGGAGAGGGDSRAPTAVGVALIRISGPLALPLLLTLTRRSRAPQPRMATRVNLYQPDLDSPGALRHFDQYRGVGAPSEPSSGAPSPAPLMIDTGILALYFPAPNSFTGEEVVELHVHGTPLLVHNTFEAIERINRRLVQQIVDPNAPIGAAAGADSIDAMDEDDSVDPLSLARASSLLSFPPLLRLATPGEFTRRAFQSGKLDLTQVEALGDLLSAQTERQRDQALLQMRGQLGELYAQWRLDLLNSLAYIEAILDFAEDEQDVGEAEVVANVLPKVRAVAASLRAHLSDHRRGELVRAGLCVVIAGAPNAGKSTLLNALSRRNVAIVSPVPGTTRDIVENRIDIAGWACTLADTAGLRQLGGGAAGGAGAGAAATDASDQPHTDPLFSFPHSDLSGHDLIEAEGMARTRERLRDSDIKLVLLDSSALHRDARHEFDAQVIDMIDERTVVVWTKVDLLPPAPVEAQTETVLAPSAAVTGRAKLRASQRFYERNRDAFTPAQLAHYRALLEATPAFQRVAARKAKMVFLACGPGETASASGANGAARAPSDVEPAQRHRGVQQLLTVLEQQIQRTVGLDGSPTGPASNNSASSGSSTLPLITRARHRVHVESCASLLDLFERYMDRGDLVLAAEQLRLATREIGKITGRVDVEELLDVIFADFCIGK